jgi:hypothetical protein
VGRASAQAEAARQLLEAEASRRRAEEAQREEDRRRHELQRQVYERERERRQEARRIQLEERRATGADAWSAATRQRSAIERLRDMLFNGGEDDVGRVLSEQIANANELGRAGRDGREESGARRQLEEMRRRRQERDDDRHATLCFECGVRFTQGATSSHSSCPDCWERQLNGVLRRPQSYPCARCRAPTRRRPVDNVRLCASCAEVVAREAAEAAEKLRQEEAAAKRRERLAEWKPGRRKLT